MLVGVAGVRQRDLMRAPGVLGLLAVDVLGACPALGRAEDDHRVHGTGLVTHLGVGLDVADLAKDLLKQACEARMDGGVRLVVESGDEEVGLVPHALEELGEFLVGDAR